MGKKQAKILFKYKKFETFLQFILFIKIWNSLNKPKTSIINSIFFLPRYPFRYDIAVRNLVYPDKPKPENMKRLGKTHFWCRITKVRI
jgi:hypothetical protein